MPSEVATRMIVRPGRDLVKAAGVLEDPARVLGTYPYQWMFPGPHSRHVLANGSIPVPTLAAGSTNILVYQVPDGWRFSLRGIVFAFFGTGWDEGSGTLLFTLSVQAAGTRKVDFLMNVATHLGSADFPFPILGRLEFAPNDTLVVSVVSDGTVTAGLPNSVTAMLLGHTYPNSEG